MIYQNFQQKHLHALKFQELDSVQMFLCLKEIFQNKKFNKNERINKPESETCNGRTVKSLSEELYKRSVLPFYTLIISLIASSLVIEPRSKYFMKFHKLNLFLIGISVIILSQLSLKFFLNSMDILYLILFLPIILVIIYYILLLIVTKFKLNYL
jgi:Predicted permease YjgP/YjgQ family.